MKFNVFRDQAGEWRWNLTAANGRIVADSSEGYKNREDCLDILFAIRADAGLTAVEVGGVETKAPVRFRTEERVRKVLTDCLCLNDEEVVPSARFREDFQADSVDAADINIFLEAEFGVSLPENGLEQFQTVGDLLTFLAGIDKAG